MNLKDLRPKIMRQYYCSLERALICINREWLGKSQNKELEVAKKVAKKTAKKRTRIVYTKADVRELRAHSKARTPVKKIVKAMKRSEGSLRQKALRLGIGLGHKR